MALKANDRFYLGSTRNHPTESKRVLVRTGKVVIKILPGPMYLFHVLQPQDLRPWSKRWAVTAEGTERQARSTVTLNKGMTDLSQVAKGSRW